jgi:argininosuccinate lyase
MTKNARKAGPSRQPGEGPGVGSRLSQGPAQELIEYGYKQEIAEAHYNFAHEMWNHKAHTAMLWEQGIIAKAAAAKILRALREIETMGLQHFPLDPAKGELFYNIESYVIRRAGEDAGGRMHTGRSRGDMYVCSERMILRERILGLATDIADLNRTILAVAARHVATVMPGYTLLQHAQPTTFAHYLLSFGDRFFRDLERLRETYRRVNQSPMGAAISTGSAFPLNRKRMAELLGFDGVVENTRDAAIYRDFTLESVTHAAIVASNVSALADDFNAWCTYEFGMIELADAYCGTSSIMPQKKNPSSLERIRYLAAECIGSTMTVFAQLKTFSEQLGDLEATGPVAWHAFDRVRAALRFMRGVLGTLAVKTDLMRQRAGANFAQATQLADEIVKQRDLAFRTAHRIVGTLVRTCLERGVSPDGVTPAMVDDAALAILGKPLKLSPETVRHALDVGRILKSRTMLGSPGAREVERMLRDRHRRLAREEAWRKGCAHSLEAARRKLDAAVRRLTR